jgi:hypothetical protein
MEYKQRVVIKFLTNERISAHEISTRLSAPLSAYTDTLHLIQFWMREIQCRREEPADERSSGRPVRDHIDAKIISMEQNAPLDPACSVARARNMDNAKALNHLQEKWGFRIGLSVACRDA